MRLARSAIRTGVPMSKTKIWLPCAIVAASITRRHASGIVMKKRLISGCVTVTGPPLAICSLNRGITLPLLPSTFPNRVVTKRVRAPGETGPPGSIPPTGVLFCSPEGSAPPGAVVASPSDWT